MLLSELMRQDTAEALAFGVEVDTDMLAPPSGLQQIGLLYQGTPEEPSDGFIDAVIACTLAGVDTIAEIAPEENITPATILTIAGNAGFSIALIPPTDENGVDAWAQRCAEFAAQFLDTPHFAGHLYPVSGYFGHLVATSVAPVDAHQPQDPYTRQRFVEAVPSAWSDRAKAAMRRAWAERVGGTEALDALLKNIAGAVVVETINLVDRILDAAEAPAHDEGGHPAA